MTTTFKNVMFDNDIDIVEIRTLPMHLLLLHYNVPFQRVMYFIRIYRSNSPVILWIRLPGWTWSFNRKRRLAKLHNRLLKQLNDVAPGRYTYHGSAIVSEPILNRINNGETISTITRGLF